MTDHAVPHDDLELRRSASIWLAQYDREEVVDLFEEVLLGAGD